MLHHLIRKCKPFFKIYQKIFLTSKGLSAFDQKNLRLRAGDSFQGYVKLFAAVCDNFDFYESALREFSDFYAGTSRQRFVEIFSVYFVNSAEEADVSQVYRRFNDIVIGKASGFQNSADVFHALFSLSRNAACYDFARFRNEGNLTGCEEEIAGFDSLGVRAYCARSVCRANNFYCHDDTTSPFDLLL